MLPSTRQALRKAAGAIRHDMSSTGVLSARGREAPLAAILLFLYTYASCGIKRDRSALYGNGFAIPGFSSLARERKNIPHGGNRSNGPAFQVRGTAPQCGIFSPKVPFITTYRLTKSRGSAIITDNGSLIRTYHAAGDFGAGIAGRLRGEIIRR